MGDLFYAPGKNTSETLPMPQLAGDYTPGVGVVPFDGRKMVTPWGEGIFSFNILDPNSVVGGNLAGFNTQTTLQAGDITVEGGDTLNNTYNIGGEQGPEGPAGPPGADGIDGLPGLPGDDGAAGAAGATGEAGATGAQGIQGVQGVQGIQGVQGVQGDAGLDGDIGATGATGVTGATGEDGTGTFVMC